MKHIRSYLSVGAVALALAVGGCSHDRHEGDDGYQASRSTTGGDRDYGRDHDQDRDHDRVRVTTRDTDHDGTDDTVAVHDHEADHPTAMDQSESAEDLEITRQIRAAVVGDSSLSFGARNCVIVTDHGVVTLQGDVNHAEHESIVRHAQNAAGVRRVDDRLNVTDASTTASD